MFTINADNILKLYVCFSGLVVSCSALFQSESMLSRMLAQIGPAAPYVMGALLLASIIGIFDVVLNDCLPSNYSFNGGLKHRTWTIAVIGGVHMVMLFLMTSHGNISWIAGRFMVDGFAATIAMFLDVQTRYIGPRKGRRVHDRSIAIGHET